MTTTRTLPLLSTTATLTTSDDANDDDKNTTTFDEDDVQRRRSWQYDNNNKCNNNNNVIIIIIIKDRIIIIVIQLRVGTNRVCCHYRTTANGRDLSRLWHPHRRRRPISLGFLFDRPRSTFAYRMLIVKSPLLSLLLNKTSRRTLTLV